MPPTRSAAAEPVAARCLAVSGEADRTPRDGRARRLHVGDELGEGDAVALQGKSSARLGFLDGTLLHISGGELSLDRYRFNRSADDLNEAVITLAGTAFVLAGSDMTSDLDSFVINTDRLAINVRAAVIAGQIGRSEYDILSLLSRPGRHPGAALVYNKTGVVSLESPRQTIRVSGGAGSLGPVLSLPTPVIREMFGDLDLSDWVGHDPEQTTPDMGVSGAAFQPFDTLGDRLFERRYIAASVFPPDTNRDPVNDLFEDSFEGRRFRLQDDDPAV